MKNEKFEVHSRSWKVWFLQLLRKSSPNFLDKILLAFLSLLSEIYSILIQLRIFFFQLGWLKTRRLPVPVVSVGNLTLGGSGKTPLVEMLAQDWVQKGKKVALLSRGYSRQRKGSSNEPQKVVLDPKLSWRTQAERWGDEPLMLAQRLPEVVVMVGKDRFKSGQKAIAEYGAQIILLDDGFQHLKLHRDVNLMLVDAQFGFGNGRLFPRGVLREPLSALKRASAFVLTHATEDKKITKQIQNWNAEAPIFYSHIKPVSYVELSTGKELPLESLQGKDVFLFSGIGRPESFEATCASLKTYIKGSVRFADHHYFSEKDLSRVLAQAKKNKVHAILTTEKDALRCPPSFLKEGLPLYFLKIFAEAPELKTSPILSNL